jgi:phospholipid/cholesterol/gamma-HCH transport system substrate-binding protein
MKRSTEAIVGATILLGIVVVVLGTLWLKEFDFGKEEVVIEARFREVGQLLKGNMVVLRGVRIGRVDAIQLEPGGDGVIVRMRIDGGVVLPPDPVVLLSPKSMFGDWQAEIQPRLQFLRYSYAEPRDAAMLPGYALPDISRLTTVADRIAENLAIVTERVEIAFTEETAMNISRAIENIEEVSAHLSGLVSNQQLTMDAVAANLAETTRTLGDAAETVHRTFAQIESAIAQGELASIVDNVERSSARMDSVTAALVRVSEDLSTVLTTADNTFRSLDAITTNLNQGNGTLGKLIQDTTLFAEITATNARLQLLLEDVRQNPRRYINLRIF